MKAEMFMKIFALLMILQLLILEDKTTKAMSEPYIPFYKPYGMSDEQYAHEIEIARQKHEAWSIEQEQLKARELTESIDLLIEDYKRKITQCEQMLRVKFQSGSVSDTELRARIQIKAIEYKAFITELERLKQ